MQALGLFGGLVHFGLILAGSLGARQLLFYGEVFAMRVECRNFNYQHSRPSYFTQRDLEIAHLLDRHVMLTTSQIKALGYPVRRLGPHGQVWLLVSLLFASG